MDIEYKNENNVFTTRVCAIIYNQDKSKVLLFKVNDGRDYFLLPGGRLQFNEDSKSAIKREVKEELDMDIEFDLCSIGEVFLNKNDTMITQYCYCYKGIYDGEINNEIIKCLDHDNQSFHWVNISDLDKYKIYPKSLYKSITSHSDILLHYIERLNID